MSTELQVVRGIAELRGVVTHWRNNGLKIALVPTMGALHAGHLALARRAGELADRTLVSIFVNPSQFAPHEDLARYPRDEAGDLAKLATEKCHLVWAPTATEMYPEGFATRIAPAGAAQGLESDFRSHFFGGVTTVCSKLFGAATPDVAVFGEKDYQQLMVIKRLARDLAIPTRIAGGPTVREPDGLAMSSRNLHLAPGPRRTAATLYQVLKDASVALAAGGAAALQLEQAVQRLLGGGFDSVDYVELRHAESLAHLAAAGGQPARLFAAAHVGGVRLIDNLPVSAP
jgi:pantoate--beta-alanine ligase